MPGDTIYISNQTGQPVSYVITATGDTLQLPDSFYGTGGYSGWTLRQEQMQKEEKERKSDSSGFFLPLLMIFFVLIGITRNTKITALDWNRKKRKKHAAAKVDEKGIQYDSWLSRYNPYYQSLSAENKKHFLGRASEFMQAKEFRFHSMVEEEYIPVLISGAAVQMTFGMRNYLMDYFPVIHVIRKEYTLDVDKETYYGHVSRNGIYISWNSFLEGYEDYADSVNVGLHEMAHAVSYDVFLGQQDRHDADFKQRLKGFAKQARPVFRSMRKGASHILDDYATTNFDEFWAVCVETFFENGEEFQRTLPDLYLSVCDLLNQDPLKQDKILDRGLAGLAN
jgi:Mlc titration factor MtfA (ptsG expression regulator)